MHTRYAYGLMAAALALACSAAIADTEPRIDSSRIVSSGGLDSMLRIQHHTSADGTVSGTVTNVSDQPIQDVRLVVQRKWVWNQEWKHEQANRADLGGISHAVIDREIAPGEQAKFIAQPARSVESPPDGHYVTWVDPVSLVRIDARQPAGIGTTPPRYSR